MVHATPRLCARLRLTTKQVGKGFYKGNRVGSTGAHTQYGGYLIDWRKVKNYNVPDLTDFKLTPYVTKEIIERDYEYDENEEMQAPQHSDKVVASAQSDKEQKRVVKFLQACRRANPGEFEQYVRFQHTERTKEQDKASEFQTELIGRRNQ